MTNTIATPSSWPSDALQSPDGVPWDLLVIGGGTAGLVGAKTAAGLGATVLLVERARTGGDCLYTGCVPSKALLSAAHAAADARAAGRLGVHVEGLRVDFAEVMAHVRESIDAIEPTDSPATLRAHRVHVAQGTVRLTGPQTAEVDGTPVQFTQALIATGSVPTWPSIDGLAASEPLTSDTVWSLTELPARLLVVGGGSIGCELGQGFGRLGAQVSIVDPQSRLLTREDEDAALLVADVLRADGVHLHLGTGVTAVRRSQDGWLAQLESGEAVAFDRVLLATGRRPDTDALDVAAADVELDDTGHVKVDRTLRTTNPRIWAAGDVTGHPQFTHLAGVHGSLAASNAVLGLRRHVQLNAVPRVTYTRPEVAAVGLTGDAAGRRGTSVRTIAHRDVDRAVTDAHTDGFTRLSLDRRERVVGATIVGPRAGESLAEVVLAVTKGLRARDLAASIHAYPTYGDGVWKVGLEELTGRLDATPARTALTVLQRIRRARLSRRDR